MLRQLDKNTEKVVRSEQVIGSISRAIEELVRNSIQHGNATKIKILFLHSDGKNNVIDHQCCHSVIQVQDDGNGIPQDALKGWIGTDYCSTARIKNTISNGVPCSTKKIKRKGNTHDADADANRKNDWNDIILNHQNRGESLKSLATLSVKMIIVSTESGTCKKVIENGNVTSFESSLSSNSNNPTLLSSLSSDTSILRRSSSYHNSFSTRGTAVKLVGLFERHAVRKRHLLFQSFGCSIGSSDHHTQHHSSNQHEQQRKKQLVAHLKSCIRILALSYPSVSISLEIVSSFSENDIMSTSIINNNNTSVNFSQNNNQSISDTAGHCRWLVANKPSTSISSSNLGSNEHKDTKQMQSFIKSRILLLLGRTSYSDQMDMVPFVYPPSHSDSSTVSTNVNNASFLSSSSRSSRSSTTKKNQRRHLPVSNTLCKPGLSATSNIQKSARQVVHQPFHHRFGKSTRWSLVGVVACENNNNSVNDKENHIHSSSSSGRTKQNEFIFVNNRIIKLGTSTQLFLYKRLSSLFQRENSSHGKKEQQELLMMPQFSLCFIIHITCPLEDVSIIVDEQYTSANMHQPDRLDKFLRDAIQSLFPNTNNEEVFQQYSASSSARDIRNNSSTLFSRAGQKRKVNSSISFSHHSTAPRKKKRISPFDDVESLISNSYKSSISSSSSSSSMKQRSRQRIVSGRQARILDNPPTNASSTSLHSSQIKECPVETKHTTSIHKVMKKKGSTSSSSNLYPQNLSSSPLSNAFFTAGASNRDHHYQQQSSSNNNKGSDDDNDESAFLFDDVFFHGESSSSSTEPSTTNSDNNKESSTSSSPSPLPSIFSSQNISSMEWTKIRLRQKKATITNVATESASASTKFDDITTTALARFQSSWDYSSASNKHSKPSNIRNKRRIIQSKFNSKKRFNNNNNNNQTKTSTNHNVNSNSSQQAQPQQTLPILKSCKISLTKKELSTSKVIGQLDTKFIIINVGDGILCAVDQHAADERVSLEKLEKTLLTLVSLEEEHNDHDKNLLQSVQLSPARSIQVSPTLMETIQSYSTSLEKWKFKFDFANHDSKEKAYNNNNNKLNGATSIPINNYIQNDMNTIILHSVPSIYGKIATTKDFLDFAKCFITCQNDNIDTNPHTTNYAHIPNFVKKVLASRACRYAIMFGEELSLGRSKELVYSLAKCDLSFVCAHGRPSVVPLLDMSSLLSLEQESSFYIKDAMNSHHEKDSKKCSTDRRSRNNMVSSLDFLQGNNWMFEPI